MMVPQQPEIAVTDQQQQLNDAEQSTDDQSSSSQCSAEEISSLISPQEFFRYIDEQHFTIMAEMEKCELERKELVQEMTAQMQSFEFSSTGNPSEDPDVFRRHAELTMELSHLHRKYNKLETQLAAVEVLAEKRKNIEASLERRLEIVNISGPDNKFTLEELRQIIESQASAALEVEILNVERDMLEAQLEEAQKQTAELKLQCSEKDERIKVLKLQNESYQLQLERCQCDSTVSTQASSMQFSNSSSNSRTWKRPATRNIRGQRLSGSSLSIPRSLDDIPKFSPLVKIRTTPKIQSAEKSSKLPSDESKETNQSGPLPNGAGISVDEDVKHEREEKKFRKKQQHLADEATKEEERRLRDQRLRNESEFLKKRQHLDEESQKKEEEIIVAGDQSLRNMAANQKKQQHLADEAKKEEERKLREQLLQEESSKEEKRKHAEQKEEQRIQERAQDNAAKEEERRIRRIQEEQQAAREARELLTLLTTPTSAKSKLQRAQLTPLSGGASYTTPTSEKAKPLRTQIARVSGVVSRPPLVGFQSTYHNQARRQAARASTRSSGGTPQSSPSPSLASKAARDMDKPGYIPTPARPPFGARPGVQRVLPDGTILEDEILQEEDSMEYTTLTSGVSSAFQVTDATLVREEVLSLGGLSERQRALEAREEALIEKQTHRMKMTAAASASPVAAVAVATISHTGSIREIITSEFSPRCEMKRQPMLPVLEQNIMTIGSNLGAGPLRFHAPNERPLRVQFNDISNKDYECFQKLQSRWEKRRKQRGCAPYSETIILRFLRNNCKSDGSFSLNKAWKAMKKTKERNLFLSASKLQKQLLTATLFPVPGLLSIAGFEMFYMKPCRFHRKDSVRGIIDNLIYVINCMSEKEQNSKNGIGFLACMNDWTMGNFDTNYCYQFMMGLQSVIVPVAVELFLIVNPPSWFGKIWKIMRPMLKPSFRKKVKVINESLLDEYLMVGYQHYLPDDLSCGTVNTFQLARDFVAYRRHAESGNVQLSAKSATIDEDESSVQSSVVSSTLVSDQGSSSVGYSESPSQNTSLDAIENEDDDASIQCMMEDTENEDDDASIHCMIEDAEAEDSGLFYIQARDA